MERPLPFSWAGQRITDVLPSQGVRLVAVTRATVPTLDVADLVGQEGDMLHLMVAIDAVERLEAGFLTADEASRP
jgi:hypothetical protein